MIALDLFHCASPQDQPRDTVHRLCYTIPATDVTPPAEFQVLGLDLVKFDLDIRRKSRTKRQRTHKRAFQDSDSRGDVTEVLQSSLLFEPLLLPTEEHAFLPGSQTDSGYSSLFSTQTSHGDEDDEMLLITCELSDEDEDDMLDVPVVPISPRAEFLSVKPTSSDSLLYFPTDNNPKKRSADMHDMHDEAGPLVVQSDCITSLVDSVLRLSIEERPWRLRQGIRVKSNGIISRLSDISPALWSPGYLQVRSFGPGGIE